MTNGTQIALIGIGTMGRGLGRNLIKAGYNLGVLDKNVAAMDELVGMGAWAAGSMEELAERCTIYITCLPSVQSIRAVYQGPKGLVELAKPESILVDCSTSDPVLSREIAEQARKRGVDYLDAPMLRNPEAAWNGTLHIIVGGDENVFEKAKPVLDSFAEEVFRVGELGAGHALKLINNAVTISNSTILYETYTVARAYGVELTLLTKVLESSMAGSKVLPIVSKRLIENDHSPLFATEVVKKDISLYTNLAMAAEAMCPIGESVRDLARIACAQGYGSDHYSRIATVLDQARPNNNAQAKPK